MYVLNVELILLLKVYINHQLQHKILTNIKQFQNFFGVVSFIKCSKVINLTLRNVFMNVLNFGGNVLKYGGTYSKQSLLHFMVVPHAVNIFRL